MRPSMAGEQERARQQQCDHRIPAVLGELLDRRDVLETRVADHGVQPTESLDRSRDRTPVALTRLKVCAEAHIASNVNSENVPAVTLQPRGNRGTDAACRTRDERCATLVAHMSIPPLTLQIAPVMNEDWSATRKWMTRAISSGRPNRPTGIFSLIPSSTFAGMFSSISVAMNPGATVLTVMPMLSSSSLPDRLSWKAASRASVLVSPNSPDLDAA